MPLLLAARFAFQFIRLLQDANVESEELSRQELLNDLVVIEEWLTFQPDATFHFAVLTLWCLPILCQKIN